MFNDPKVSRSTLSEARQLMHAHHTEEAMCLVNELIAREPGNLDAWLFLAFYYMDFDYHRALDAWKQIARLPPNDPTAWHAINVLSSYLA
jgi:cytochrome c-type biogenesis protein CcmH/NrfG